MILSDTSAWVDHFRVPDACLADWLNQDLIVTHPFVLGELFCGLMRDRAGAWRFLNSLRMFPPVLHEEAIALLENGRLFGMGIGWVDLHLLAAARLHGLILYTADRRLQQAAEKAGVSVQRAPSVH